MSQSELLPSRFPSTWGSIPKLGIQSQDLGCNPYAFLPCTWPPSKVPLAYKHLGLGKICLGHILQLLITSEFIHKLSKHSKQTIPTFPGYPMQAWVPKNSESSGHGRNMSGAMSIMLYKPLSLSHIHLLPSAPYIQNYTLSFVVSWTFTQKLRNSKLYKWEQVCWGMKKLCQGSYTIFLGWRVQGLMLKSL